MTPHPFHPDSPQYDAMLAAGRIGTRIRAELRNGCPFDGEPIAGDMRRTDYLRAPRFRVCRDHLFWAEGNRNKGQPVAVRWWCSVCEKPVKAGYELDGSGRCSECQP
jgi:hypothetical protein